MARLDNHKHFIQGAAWDPAQQFVVTQSADRTCKWVVIVIVGDRKGCGVWGWGAQCPAPCGDQERGPYLQGDSVSLWGHGGGEVGGPSSLRRLAT